MPGPDDYPSHGKKGLALRLFYRIKRRVAQSGGKAEFSMLKTVFLRIINFYRLYISPYTPHTCIYTPSCSTYMYQAVSKYGPFRGTLKGIKRLLRCHPFHKGGWDPLD
ncbi:MAG TPA: membrane protein insertion efficiency factor YidD [Firmicutes bacterium]|nr:membrane protein insertion efficiency factor YidD [Bacillota bacterium]